VAGVEHRPGSAEDVVEIVGAAVAAGTPLVVRGAGAKLSARGEAPAGAAVLDVRGLAGIVDYDPEELVITLGPGTPLAEVEALLAARGQMLAFEPFDHGLLMGAGGGGATIGGIVAANVSGSRRVSAGAARDHVLGFEAVSGRGEAFKGGGAVVKNVTGYDLPKLMAGSWGTLAVLTQLTLRVLPRPRSEKTLLLQGLSDPDAVRLMTLALGLPSAVAAAAHRPGEAAVTALRVEGFAPSVDARCDELPRALKPLCRVDIVEGEESAAVWRGLARLDGLSGEALWRLVVPGAQAWRAGERLKAAGADYLYDWGGGLIWAATAAGDARPAQIAREAGGWARFVRGAPIAEAEAPESALARLGARVKAAFDPAGVLNPHIRPGREG
jgi:glycolate oxidase FAD binding subunit